MRTLTSLALLAGVAWLDMKVAEAAPPERKAAKRSLRDYSDRSGFPRPAEEMRGIARQASLRMTPPLEPTPRAEDSRSALTAAVAGAAS